MTCSLQFMRASLLLHLIFEASADAGIATRAACCEPEQDIPSPATCSSLLQSNQTRKSRTSLEIEDKLSLSSHVKDTNLSQAGRTSLAQKSQVALNILAKRFGLSLISIFNMRKVEPDAEDGGSWTFPIITLLLLLVLGGYLYMHVRDKRRASAEPSHASPAFMAGNTPNASLLPSAKSVPHKPRPSQSMRPSTAPSGPAAKDPTPSPSILPELFLCPGLVVPDQTECTLIVPRIDHRGTKMLQVSIDDCRGVSVFRMELYPQPARDGSRLVLLSPNGDTIFARCKDVPDASQYGHPERTPALGIYGQNVAQPFGLLVNNGRSFEVSTLTKQRIRFQGQSGSLNAVDEQDKLLALSDPAPDGPRGAKRRTVRIGPLVDAGLMTICYLGVDVMESSTPTFSGSMMK
eukprot:TRINITY_DN21298_c0_g1_i1.p1 TRINITY_DN21298_c0_g1~~TRINITY_DN21298_c0_g1_i1.p1  ORF type:complete len:405 (-),score=50.65 TRINITY_DN21298_c0_g1_i1:65-1279(-)